MWCPTVSSGAFVARRNGQIFITGNSGFPKSHDISKALDREAGAERENGQLRTDGRGKWDLKVAREAGDTGVGHADGSHQHYFETLPATPLATQWQGYGTALKPAYEPVILARAPRAPHTYAALARAFGTGAINVDGARVETAEPEGRAHRDARNTVTPSMFGAMGGSRAIGTTTLGRWPANVILGSYFDKVLRLRYNIPDDIKRVIREYFDGNNNVSTMRETVGSSSESSQERTGEILQSGMLRGLAERKPARRKSSDVGQAPQRRIARENENHQTGTGQDNQGEEPSHMEGGQAYFSGLCDDCPVNSSSRGTTEIRANGGSVETECHTGAPSYYGTASQSATDTKGSRTSQEWDQDRQSNRKPGDLRQELTFEETSIGEQGTSEFTGRERTSSCPDLEIVESAIPVRWLQYFEDTGRRIEHSAAAALDAQSGELRNGGQNETAPQRDGMFGVRKAQVAITEYAGDSGGASRFFYTAKAAAWERTAGLSERSKHPTMKPIRLTEYLATLLLPPALEEPRRLLVPFSGVGSEMIGAQLTGWDEIDGVEQDEDYVEIAKSRIEWWSQFSSYEEAQDAYKKEKKTREKASW